MNIKIADRLVKLRKANGLSQEELADKLGLSRQAVSKWERAEASPDTDNLICLAKLYGVSLDELLQDDDDIETIVKEQVKGRQEETKEEDVVDPDDEEDKEEKKKPKSSVHIGKDGIHVVEDGEEVHIDATGIHVNEDGKPVHLVKPKAKTKFWLIASIASGSAFFLALLALILVGCLVKGGWSWSWTFMLLVPVVISIPDSIKHKKISHFAYPFLTAFVYFFVCLAITPMWHPLWVVFVSIPVFYSIVCPIDKYLESKRGPCIIIDEDDDD